MLSLKNNFLFWFWEPASSALFKSFQSAKTLSGKHDAGYAVEDCVVAFLRFWAFCIYPQEKISVGKFVALLA